MRGAPISYSAEELAFVKNNCNLHRSELTKQFNQAFNRQISKNNIAGLCKRKQWLTGRTGRFEKGQSSWNKDHTGYMGPNKTSFKKGSIPANIKPIGHERICSKDGYILINVAEKNPYTNAQTRYRHKQHVVWEKHNEPIPKSMIIAFIDGNKLNCAIDNLELISLGENLQRNRLRINEAPPELRDQIRALAKHECIRFKKTNELSK